MAYYLIIKNGIQKTEVRNQPPQLFDEYFEITKEEYENYQASDFDIEEVEVEGPLEGVPSEG